MTSARTDAPEWMDDPAAPSADVERALADLRMVNRWFGGTRALWNAIAPHLDRERPLRVLDVGTGSADVPRALLAEARRRGLSLVVVAVDRDRRMLEAAREGGAEPDLVLVQADARNLPFRDRDFDLVTASLFLHHFADRDLAGVLRRWLALARVALVVNDLRRDRLHWLLVHAIGLVTARGRLFRHDGPLSVLRAFTADELATAARAAGARSCRVRRVWPYRLVLEAEP
jgi:SAM-dependent methyltransferase